jgi:hypothetical protein
MGKPDRELHGACATRTDPRGRKVDQISLLHRNHRDRETQRNRRDVSIAAVFALAQKILAVSFTFALCSFALFLRETFSATYTVAVRITSHES